MNLMKIEQQQTMSTREIAELTGKRHDNVMEDARRTLAELELHAPDFSGAYKISNGNEYECFNLPKRETLILVSGYSVTMRAKIIDRWQELEAKNKELETYGMLVPKTYGEALVALGNNLIVIEQQSKQLEQAKPKVTHYDNYVDSSSLKTVTNSAKEMKLTSNVLWNWLRANNHAFKSKTKNIWTKDFITKGYGEMKQFTNKDGSFSGTTAYLTPTGDLFIKQNFAK